MSVYSIKILQFAFENSENTLQCCCPLVSVLNENFVTTGGSLLGSLHIFPQ